MKRMALIFAVIIAVIIGNLVFGSPEKADAKYYKKSKSRTAQSQNQNHDHVSHADVKARAETKSPKVRKIQTAPAPTAEIGKQIPARLVKVSDGDTVWLAPLDGGGKFKVRFYGIDAPESTQGQPYGKEAAKRLAELLTSEYAYYELTGHDLRWGRMVAKIWDEHDRKTSVNEKLVAEGLAWHYTQYAPHDTRLAELQAHAQRFRLGLWQSGNPVAPWDWRHQRMGNKR